MSSILILIFITAALAFDEAWHKTANRGWQRLSDAFLGATVLMTATTLGGLL